MVEVVVPWRGGCSWRTRVWQYIHGRYLAEHRGWRVTLAPAPPGPWVKAAAVAPAVAASTADIIVVADADVWTDGLDQAVEQVVLGEPWAVPHGDVHRLDTLSTRKVLEGGPLAGELEERAYQGVWGGGILVLPRELARDVPLDPRFTGWGQEDLSWAIALHHLAGAGWRGTAPLWHLWHPPQERETRRWGNPDGRTLHRRYLDARNSPAAMRALIEEAKCSLIY